MDWRRMGNRRRSCVSGAALSAIILGLFAWQFLSHGFAQEEDEISKKTSRVRADLRTAATALESFRVDWNRYPDFTDDLSLSNDSVLALTLRLGILSPKRKS